MDFVAIVVYLVEKEPAKGGREDHVVRIGDGRTKIEGCFKRTAHPIDYFTMVYNPVEPIGIEGPNECHLECGAACGPAGSDWGWDTHRRIDRLLLLWLAIPTLLLELLKALLRRELIERTEKALERVDAGEAPSELTERAIAPERILLGSELHLLGHVLTTPEELAGHLRTVVRRYRGWLAEQTAEARERPTAPKWISTRVRARVLFDIHGKALWIDDISPH